VTRAQPAPTPDIAAWWSFGDQLGPHFTHCDSGDPAEEDKERPVILIESVSSLRRRPYHRQKVHLVISALRHRAAELGDRAVYVRAETFRAGFAEALSRLRMKPEQIAVRAPTSYGARRLCAELGVQVLPSVGFVTSEDEFSLWANGRGDKRLLLEDFYRNARKRTGILMDGDDPVGGRWNLDADNRQPPPRGRTRLDLPTPAWPVEDHIDEEVRQHLNALEESGQMNFIGQDGPRLFAATREEALSVLEDFTAHRLADFGPYEDATMAQDWVMAHSLLSAPLNLGLLDPREAIDSVESVFRRGDVPLASAEGFIRQVMGWRDYVWHLYWHLGEDYGQRSNALSARTPLPEWWRDLDAESVTARCMSATLADIRERGWVHHIPRLMILGNWALQQGYDPQETTEWFTSMFVDAYPWVMAANVIGMALYADGGVMATKPYASGGAYLKRMTDYCSGCAYRPTERTGERACPYTSGYWTFIARNSEQFRGNHRMAQPLRGMEKLGNLDQVIATVAERGSDPP
jgi:deoxyribodipyrimidine photolyase-related protein